MRAKRNKHVCCRNQKSCVKTDIGRAVGLYLAGDCRHGQQEPVAEVIGQQLGLRGGSRGGVGHSYVLRQLEVTSEINQVEWDGQDAWHQVPNGGGSALPLGLAVYERGSDALTVRWTDHWDKSSCMQEWLCQIKQTRKAGSHGICFLLLQL